MGVRVTRASHTLARMSEDHAGLRTGADYLDRLRRDERRVIIDGETVRDVTSHPAFRAAARSVAGLWDIAAAPENRSLMTYASPRTGRPVLRCWEIPRAPGDLATRHGMIERWAEATFGLMGRTPDHVAGFFTGFAAKPGIFAAAGAHFAANVVRFYEEARDNHLYVSYAIVPPQFDRSKPAHQQSDPTLHAGVVAERDGGIVLRGAQQMATGAALSDYLHLSCIHPLQPGDEAYAISVAMPITAPGLKIYARRSYAAAASSAFDYPLSSRFDEGDALVVLDDVFVPWERVFVYRDIALCRDQWWQTPAHVLGNHQAQIRYATKLRFLMGLAKRLTEITRRGGAAAGADPCSARWRRSPRWSKRWSRRRRPTRRSMPTAWCGRRGRRSMRSWRCSRRSIRASSTWCASWPAARSSCCRPRTATSMRPRAPPISSAMSIPPASPPATGWRCSR